MHLRKQTTEKLFYNKYAYKLLCRNDLANEFRNNRLHHVGKLLDGLQLSYENGEPLQLHRFRTMSISQASFEDAKVIYNELKKHRIYRLRVQFKQLTIYSTYKPWLYDLSTRLRQSLEWWEPEERLNPLEPGYAYLKRPIDYEYRVYLRGKLPLDAAQWLLAHNGEHVKLGNTLEEYLNEGMTRLDDLYFYAKSDRVITLLRLLMVDNIRSINKVVCLNKNA